MNYGACKAGQCRASDATSLVELESAVARGDIRPRHTPAQRLARVQLLVDGWAAARALNVADPAAMDEDGATLVALRDKLAALTQAGRGS